MAKGNKNDNSTPREEHESNKDLPENSNLPGQTPSASQSLTATTAPPTSKTIVPLPSNILKKLPDWMVPAREAMNIVFVKTDHQTIGELWCQFELLMGGVGDGKKS